MLRFCILCIQQSLNPLGKFNQKPVWPFWRMGWWENGGGDWRNVYSFACVRVFWMTGCAVKISLISLVWNRKLICWVGLKLRSKISWSKSVGQRATGVGRGWDWKKQPRKRRLDREVWDMREDHTEKAELDGPGLASENRTTRAGKSQELGSEQIRRTG